MANSDLVLRRLGGLHSWGLLVHVLIIRWNSYLRKQSVQWRYLLLFHVLELVDGLDLDGPSVGSTSGLGAVRCLDCLLN